MAPHTVPATQENLQLEVDDHPMAESRPERVSDSHPVLVDGIVGTAAVGCFGAYSLRLVVQLESEHPDLGTEFGTKHFRFVEPGLVEWGGEPKRFRLLKMVQG